MKRLIIGVSVIILSLVGIAFFASGSSNQSTVGDVKVAEMAEKELATLSEEIKSVNGQLIDVREPSEYEIGHADGAINIPLGDIMAADYSKIDSGRPIYLICRSGGRAEQAKAALEQAGYENITNIGGLVDWEEQGDKICSASTPSCS